MENVHKIKIAVAGVVATSVAQLVCRESGSFFAMLTVYPRSQNIQDGVRKNGECPALIFFYTASQKFQ